MAKQNALNHPKAKESAAITARHSATTVQAVKLALPTTDATLAPWLMATTATKKHAGACAGNFARTPKSCATVRSGASNTTQTAEILPDSEVFSRPKFTVASLAARSYGLDGRSGNARRTTVCVLLTSSPPFARSKAVSGFQQFKQELEAMSASKGHLAPTLKATPANSHFDPVAAHIQAVNALAMAKFYANRHNHAGAKRKAVQALSALRQLAAFERVEVAHAV